jgi:transcriptional regulator of met regulon
MKEFNFATEILADKSNFRKVTITLPHDVYQRLMEESVTRKIAGAPNQTMSALLRETLLLYLEKTSNTPARAS